MKTSKYLYDVDSIEWSELPYSGALESKIAYAMDNLKRISTEAEKHHYSSPIYKLLMYQYADVEKAIGHNRRLLNEIRE